MSSPRAFYSEWDKKTAAWLRELIKRGLIPDGDVDERSITELKGSDLDGYTQVHLFAGIGGWPYALRLAGWPDDRAVWTGSCPCQDFSNAGKQAGFGGSRDLWPDMRRIIQERIDAQRAPNCIFGEQSDDVPAWYDRLARDMELLDYACGALVVPACALGAHHVRSRLWWVASRADADSVRPQGQRTPQEEPWSREQFEGLVQATLRASVPSGASGGLSDGVPARVVRLRGYGNSVSPQVAAAFITSYLETLNAKD